MDRRRFVPAAEGLEGRALLSFFKPPKLPAAQPQTFTVAQKIQRIERLPFFLRSTVPGRILPDSAIAPVQADLSAIKGLLHSPPSAALADFNVNLRNIIPHASLHAEDSRSLNQSFGRVLELAGTAPNLVAQFKADMNNLSKLDANDTEPVILATDDYSTILQTALGVGRPIRTPGAPRLAPSDAINKGGRVTTVREPRFVGLYEANATIQLLDSTGQVVGSTIVNKLGKYSVAFNTPLSDGTYTVRVRAVDTDEFSAPSPPFTFRVVSRPSVRVTTSLTHPAGPLGL